MSLANGQFPSRSYMSDRPTRERAKRAATVPLVLFSDVSPKDREAVPCWAAASVCVGTGPFRETPPLRDGRAARTVLRFRPIKRIRGAKFLREEPKSLAPIPEPHLLQSTAGLFQPEYARPRARPTSEVLLGRSS
jgi:hypothetical protein